RRNGRGKLGHAVVEKREPCFDGVRDGHAVSLRREDIAGQEKGGFQVLSLGKRIPSEIALRDRCFQLLVGVFLQVSRLHFIGKKHLQSGGEPPSRKVREERVQEISCLHAEERLKV